MSLDGMIAHRGSVATVHHALDTRSVDGDSARTYPTSTTGVGLFVEAVSDELLRRVFGAETKATHRALAAALPSLALDDGIAITAGPFAGQRFTIASCLPHLSGATPHQELALISTTESFT